jgi:hypothetical protein
MNRLTIDLHQALADMDLVTFFIATSGIILFWVLMAWILFFILDKMR